jgi:hypothetical protein
VPALPAPPGPLPLLSPLSFLCAGEKRLEQHLQFLLANLSYEHASGRQAALDMLGVVLAKFPPELVSRWAEMVGGGEGEGGGGLLLATCKPFVCVIPAPFVCVIPASSGAGAGDWKAVLQIAGQGILNPTTEGGRGMGGAAPALCPQCLPTAAPLSAPLPAAGFPAAGGPPGERR